jgi:aryl-alcohol dehydrogenase-like predicted oxidoreductase
MVDLCLDRGINFFDTANVYNKGVSEEVLGRAIRGKRDTVVVASKVRGKMGDGPAESGLSRQAIEAAIDASLKRLGTDYLDLYYLHMPDPAVPIEETLEAVDRLVRSGKVRYPASSNYAGWQVCEMLWLAEKKGYKPAVVTQPMYNVLARGIESEYLPMCRRFNLASFVYNPLAGGLLSGKQSRQGPITGTRFDNNSMYLNRYWHDVVFDAVDRLKTAAGQCGRSLISLSLNWLMRHTQVTGVILGASRIDHLEQNLSALDDGPLPPEVLALCDQVWADLRGVTPQYNR